MVIEDYKKCIKKILDNKTDSDKTGRNILEAGLKITRVCSLLYTAGHDIFDESILESEVSCSNKGKVDIILNTENTKIMIEVKNESEDLTEKKHLNQLKRYFDYYNEDISLSILTNGIEYHFFEPNKYNKMKKNPFYTMNLLEMEDYDYDNLMLLLDKGFIDRHGQPLIDIVKKVIKSNHLNTS